MNESTPQPVALSRSIVTRAWVVFLGVAIASIVLDLASKSWAFARIAGTPVRVERADVLAAGPGKLWSLLPEHAPRTVVPKVLDFTLVLNPGAVFGIGAGKRWFFVIFTGIAAAACVVMFLRWRRSGDWLSLSRQ